MYQQDNSVASMITRGHHPATWDEFIGQGDIKHKLQTTAKSAALRNARMPHIIVNSPDPGVGKTSLALLAASEAGADRAKVVTGVITKDRALEIFDELGDGGVVIWDEFQTAFADKKSTQWLYHYLQHGVFAEEDGFVEAPAVTIIGATTHIGDMPPAVKQRFQVLHLVKYNDDEAMEIARSTWEKIAGPHAEEFMLSDDTCMDVAIAASGRPRYMQQIWQQILDLLVTGQLEYFNDPGAGIMLNLETALKWAGFTDDGMTESCVRYMDYLMKNKQRPRGITTIVTSTGIAKSELAEVETLLIEKGYVEDTGRGRCLSRAGKARMRELMAEAA